MQRTIKSQDVRADVDVETRIAEIRSAIRHLNRALAAYQCHPSGTATPNDGTVGGMFEAAHGPISLAAAYHAIVCAAFGR